MSEPSQWEVEQRSGFALMNDGRLSYWQRFHEQRVMRDRKTLRSLLAEPSDMVAEHYQQERANGYRKAIDVSEKTLALIADELNKRKETP